MNRDTSNEKEVLLVNDLPTSDSSPTYPSSTNPHAPTNPSRQFHSILSIYLLSWLLAAFFLWMDCLYLTTFSSRQLFWYLFFLMSMMTFSKTELWSSFELRVGYSTILFDWVLEETIVDYYSFLLFMAIRSFSSLHFFCFIADISFFILSTIREWD